MGLVNIDCPDCPEPMWIETIADLMDTWWVGVEHERLKALLDMRFTHVWECYGCGHFEPVYGRVSVQGG